MMSSPRLASVLLFGSLALLPATGQDVPPPGDDGAAVEDPAIENKIPKDLENTVRVRFHLKNGSKVIGWVKNGRFIESIRDHRFVRSEALEGNGVRVWPEHVEGFIFLEWDQIRDIEILRPTTPEEEKVEEEEAARLRRERLERARLVDEDTKRHFEDLQKKDDEAAKARLEAEEKATARKEIEERYRAVELLEKFPPDKGWSQEKYDQIRLAWLRDPDKNRIVPQGENKEFYESFEAWKEALEWKQKGLLESLPPRPETSEPAPGGPEAGTPPGPAPGTPPEGLPR